VRRHGSLWALPVIALLVGALGCSDSRAPIAEAHANGGQPTLSADDIDGIAALIADDPVLGDLVGSHPVLTNTAPWDIGGVVTYVAVEGGPRNVRADFRGYECMAGTLRGGEYRTEATAVMTLMVWVDLNRNQVVATYPGGESTITAIERVRPAYFPGAGSACQDHD